MGVWKLPTSGAPNTLTETVEDQEKPICPNPANDFMMINLNDEYLGTVGILYNGMGQAILQQKIIQNESKIQLSHLPAGVYYFSIKEKNYLRKVNIIH